MDITVEIIEVFRAYLRAAPTRPPAADVIRHDHLLSGMLLCNHTHSRNLHTRRHRRNSVPRIRITPVEPTQQGDTQSLCRTVDTSRIWRKQIIVITQIPEKVI